LLGKRKKSLINKRKNSFKLWQSLAPSKKITAKTVEKKVTKPGTAHNESQLSNVLTSSARYVMIGHM